MRSGYPLLTIESTPLIFQRVDIIDDTRIKLGKGIMLSAPVRKNGINPLRERDEILAGGTDGADFLRILTLVNSHDPRDAVRSHGHFKYHIGLAYAR